MSKLIDQKYPEERDKDKHEQLMKQVKESMDEEERTFRLTSVKIKHHRDRKTVKKVTMSLD